MSNLVELMAKRIAKSCPWLPINGEFRVAECALDVVKKHIGLVAEACTECHGDYVSYSNEYPEGKVWCDNCQRGVIARTEGDV